MGLDVKQLLCDGGTRRGVMVQTHRVAHDRSWDWGGNGWPKKQPMPIFQGMVQRMIREKLLTQKHEVKIKIPRCRTREDGSVWNLKMLGVTVSAGLQFQSLSVKLVAGQENSWMFMGQLPWCSKEIHSQAVWKMRTETWGCFVISAYACIQVKI